MPIATPEVYAQMLDRAKASGFAYPAINVTSSETLNAALAGFAEAESDGIVQISTGGAEFLSGRLADMVTGAAALAEFAHTVARGYPVHIALHTDHCQKERLDTYMRPLIALSAERVAAGRDPLFQSHMWDGSALPLSENLAIARDLLGECARARLIMELEIGVVGGEEDGISAESDAKLYSTPEDALRAAEVLGTGERGRYILAGPYHAAMAESEPAVRVTDNPAAHRFEAHLGDALAGYAEYVLAPGRVIFTHTQTLSEFEGRGVGTRLAAGALDEVRARGLAVTAKCPFIRGYIERHPEYADLVDRTHDAGTAG